MNEELFLMIPQLICSYFAKLQDIKSFHSKKPISLDFVVMKPFKNTYVLKSKNKCK